MRENRFFTILLCAVFYTAILFASDEIAPWYEYDREAALKPEIISRVEGKNYEKVYFRYTSVGGEVVPGVLTLPDPDAHKPPFPVIVLMHGYMQDKENFIFAGFHKPFADKGWATVAIDAPYHGERPGKMEDAFRTIETSEQFIKQYIFDVFRLLDYIETLPELDTERVGYFGISMGTIVGAIAAGIDERIRAMVLTLGGGDLACVFKDINVAGAKNVKGFAGEEGVDALVERFAYLDPVSYLRKISGRPVMFYNTRDDMVVRKECAENFHNAVGEPKKVIWGKGGHVLFPQQIVNQAIEWYGKYLDGGK
ncbi:MAG: alpha/beta fold hydrolase [bacterium]